MHLTAEYFLCALQSTSSALYRVLLLYFNNTLHNQTNLSILCLKLCLFKQVKLYMGMTCAMYVQISFLNQQILTAKIQSINAVNVSHRD